MTSPCSRCPRSHRSTCACSQTLRSFQTVKVVSPQPSEDCWPPARPHPPSRTQCQAAML